MKKLIILLIIGFAGWKIYQQQRTPVITNADLKLLNPPIETIEESSSFYEQEYSCDGRQHCSQMSSCEEATFFIQNCPNTNMDGDHDCIPSERQHCW